MKRCLLSALALLLVLCTLTGCASHGKTLLSVGNEEISIHVYQLYLSRMKGTLASAGEKVNDANYWKTILSVESGETVGQHYTNQVFEGLRQIAAALYLYNELGLKLSGEELDAIDAWIDTLIEEVGEGSKAQLNSILNSFGANVTVLRDAAIIEAKVEQLKTHLYGKDGSLLSATAKEEFYQKTYYRGRQMLVANYYYDHEKDSEGNTVYYGTGGKIAYDTVNGVATDKTDKNGDVIYRHKNGDGSLGAIAYDKEKGSIKYYYDSNNEHKIAYYTENEMKERREVLEAIAEDCKGNEARFLEYAEKWADNADFNEKFAPNGMYFSAGTYTSDTVFYTFATELAKLEVGDLAILNSDSGYYLIMRVELDAEAWSVDENSRWFGSLNTLAVEYMLQQRTADYLQYVTVDEALKATTDISMVAANNYY